MYRVRGGQTSIFDDEKMFGGVELDIENHWIKLSKLIPWAEVEKRYAQTFKGKHTGNPGCNSRMAIGSLIIKERYGFSDQDTVDEIQMNPYLQYFIGLTTFTHKAPFDQSTMTLFRKRITPQMLSELNDFISGRRNPYEEKEDDDQDDSSDEDPNGKGGNTNDGTLILDATCVPQDIRYPTDGSLLNEAREKLENMIDVLHANVGGKKPRTYRKIAHKVYCRLIRNRKPSKKLIRKFVRTQLGYVKRNLGIVDALMQDSTIGLSARQATQLETIRALYYQQKTMYDGNVHTIANRIVSIAQPWVRPIVRGKTKAPVEFGAKIEVSLVDGYAQIEAFSWEAFNEGTTLIDSVKRYYANYGHFPARILADRIFRTRDNLAFCKQLGIRMNGPKLGRPLRDKEVHKEQLRLERAESGERSAVECYFGVGKRRYTLNLIKTRLATTSEVSIRIALLTMNLFRKLRFLFCLICAPYFNSLKMRLHNCFACRLRLAS